VRDELAAVVVVRPELLDETEIRDTATSVGTPAVPFSDLDLACAHLGLDTSAVRATLDELRDELDQRSYA
jgi:hypothetical protein